ncbi:hypothetical protein ACMXYV_15595 [Neptuniibacter sp. SY11_33]|uniref:hypothetical protein n=1 Tax=Neptuniibacter sp. SY11_33 TaxID=3398215 RepID=UPI0039F53816
MIKFLTPLILLVLSGCTQNVQPISKPTQLDQITVTNLSNQTLTSVRIEVLSTRSKIVCQQVAPNGFCAFRFKARPLRGETAQIDWQIGDQQWYESISAKDVEISKDWFQVKLNLTLTADGQAKIIAIESH